MSQPSPSPRARAGKVHPEILKSGLGLLGSYVIPQDIWKLQSHGSFMGCVGF